METSAFGLEHLVKYYEERPATDSEISAEKKQEMGKHPRLHPFRARRVNDPSRKWSRVANDTTGGAVTVSFKGKHADASARQLKPGQKGYLL